MQEEVAFWTAVDAATSDTNRVPSININGAPTVSSLPVGHLISAATAATPYSHEIMGAALLAATLETSETTPGTAISAASVGNNAAVGDCGVDVDAVVLAMILGINVNTTPAPAPVDTSTGGSEAVSAALKVTVGVCVCNNAIFRPPGSVTFPHDTLPNSTSANTAGNANAVAGGATASNEGENAKSNAVDSGFDNTVVLAAAVTAPDANTNSYAFAHGKSNNIHNNSGGIGGNVIISDAVTAAAATGALTEEDDGDGGNGSKMAWAMLAEVRRFHQLLQKLDLAQAQTQTQMQN